MSQLTMSRWLIVLAGVVSLGMCQVAQRNAIVFSAYGVGERMVRVHTEETDVTWLRARVDGLASPVHLANVARAQQLKLIARTTLDAATISGNARLAASSPASGHPHASAPAPSVIHLAAAGWVPPPVDNDQTTD